MKQRWRKKRGSDDDDDDEGERVEGAWEQEREGEREEKI